MTPYPARFRERALAALDHGTPVAVVAETLAVDRSTLYRWRRRRLTGAIGPTSPPGRARLIGLGQAAALQAQVDAHPDATLAEHAARRTLGAGHGTVGQRADHEPGRHAPRHHPQKKSLIATERDEVARAAWRQEIQPTLDPATTVFVDETSTNTAMTRRYGRAPRGQRVVDRAPRNHGRNVTVLAALGPQGIIASVAVPGAADRAVLAAFLTHELLPRLPTGTRIVWDNLSVHRGEAIGDLIAGAACERVFLPTYSPDLNPIETAFSMVKEDLRGAKARDHDRLITAMGAALDRITPAMAQRMIAHCGYRPPSQPL